MGYAVDMNGFKHMRDDYILKELAFIPLSYDGDPLVRLFKHPFSWKKLPEEVRAENLRLKYNYHGISWKTDGLEYNTIGSFLREAFFDASRIFVLDELRREWLTRLKLPVYNIQEYGYNPSKPPFKCVTVCTYHNPIYKTNCALHNVKLMKLFYQSSIRKK